ncbi:MAG: hypothetical protein ABW079_15270 [Sedimenticola sp.]
MKYLRTLLCLIAIIAITGCAHPITIGPNIENIQPHADIPAIEKNAGYTIPDSLRKEAVTTPGGGGDKVTYYPYKDIETSFYKMLSNTFDDVTVLKSSDDTAAIIQHEVDYIITPHITTDSSSPSAFTWPPTDFTVHLSCIIADIEGNVIASPSVTGTGHAEYEEFKSDFSLSGKRATEDALKKMQTKLLTLPKLRIHQTQHSKVSTSQQ